MMVGRSVLILLVTTFLCGVLGDADEPCARTSCDLNENCYHMRSNQENDENGNAIPGEGTSMEAICIDRHGFEEVVGALYKKSCPEIREIGIGGDIVDCGSVNFENKCTLDEGCDKLTHMCCYDGCRFSCRRFILSSKNHQPPAP